MKYTLKKNNDGLVSLKTKKETAFWKKDGLFVRNLFLNPINLFAMIGSIVLFSIAIIIILYFYYNHDWNSVAGFIGYLFTLDMLSLSIFVPVLGIVVAFYFAYYWNVDILAFFELTSNPLTEIIKNIYFFGIIILNSLVLIGCVALIVMKSTGALDYLMQNLDGKEESKAEKSELRNRLIYFGIIVSTIIIIILWINDYVAWYNILILLLGTPIAENLNWFSITFYSTFAFFNPSYFINLLGELGLTEEYAIPLTQTFYGYGIALCIIFVILIFMLILEIRKKNYVYGKLDGKKKKKKKSKYK